MSSRFWPVSEPAQADYEQLRALVLAGERLEGLLAARRFARRGLAGLISWPPAEPDYSGVADRRASSCLGGTEDPREQQLRDAYGFLLAGAGSYSVRAVGE